MLARTFHWCQVHLKNMRCGKSEHKVNAQYVRVDWLPQLKHRMSCENVNGIIGRTSSFLVTVISSLFFFVFVFTLVRTLVRIFDEMLRFLATRDEAVGN